MTDVFREGRVHVMSEQCATCVFRPGNLMRLAPGRLRGMIDDCLKEDTIIPCHSTLYGAADHQAVCRGLYDRHAGDILPLRLAQAFGIVAWQDPPPKGDDA